MSSPLSEDARRLERVFRALLSCQRSSWEQGVAAQALLEWHLSPQCASLSDAFSREVLLDYLYGFAHDAIVRQAPDGRLAVCLNGTGSSDPGAVDPCCVGEAFYYLSEMENVDQERFKGAVHRMLDFILKECPRAPVGPPDAVGQTNQLLLSHRVDVVEIWSDAVYMLPSFLAASAVYSLRHDKTPIADVASHVRMSLEQIILASRALQAPSGEWSHIYSMEKQGLKRKAFWGVGNGWVCAGIVRVFRTMAGALLDPRTESGMRNILETAETKKLLQDCHVILRTTLDACLKYIRSDGLFHDILDDPSSFVETNLSQELSYTLYRLLDLHLHSPSTVTEYLALPSLDENVKVEWAGRADQMRQAAVKKTDRWGFVRDVCGSPRFKSAGTATEGQAFAILMEVARADYLANVGIA